MFSKNIRKNIDHLKSDIAAIEAQLVDLEKLSAKPGKPVPVRTKPIQNQKIEKGKCQLQTNVLKKDIASKPEKVPEHASVQSRCPCQKEVVKTITYEACGECLVDKCCNKPKKNCCCDCNSNGSTVEHVHHRICIPTETGKSLKYIKMKHKSHRVNKKDDANATWADILTSRKGTSPEKRKENAATAAKKQSCNVPKEKQSSEVSKKLEEKDKAIAKLSEKLKSHEICETRLKAIMSSLQKELKEAHEAQERLRLEAQLKTLEEEKTKVLLAAKDIVLDDVIRKTQALDNRLQQQRDFDRNVAANIEVENALLLLKTKFPYLDMNSVNNSTFCNESVNMARSSPIKNPKAQQQKSSTPTSEINSSDRISSWHAISKIDKI